MEVYKNEELKDIYYFVWGRVNDAVWALRVSGGSLGKWKFGKYPEEKFDKFHQRDHQHKGDIPDDIKKSVLEAIFAVKSELLRNGPSGWG